MKKTPAEPQESLHRGRFVELVKEGRWEYVRRVKAKGAVFVLAMTDARELILVEQYRVPVHARTIELPAGIYGDDESAANESPEDCAIRELEEESGYRGAKARVLLTGPVAPGLTTEIMYLVRVENLERVHAGGGVGGEDITVHCIGLDRLDGWLEQQREAGRMVEPRVYAGLHFLAKEG
ncbi:MAG TPA: NUDIX hydrolase [Verrucomicrobiae bacterium]|nr:NUDIX hydrolase [Verrucomicrobiae bacterium]